VLFSRQKAIAQERQV